MSSKKAAVKKSAPAKKVPAKKPAPEKKATVKKPAAKAPDKTSGPNIGTDLCAELSKATGLEVNKDENEKSYAERLAEKVAEFTDDAFGKLSKAAQKWFNDTAEAINAEKPEKIPALVGFPSLDLEKSDETSSPAAGKVSRKTAAPKADKVDGMRANNSPTQRIRIEVCKKPNIGLEELTKKLKDAGHKSLDESYIRRMWERTKAVLDVKAAVDAGTLK